MNKEEVCARIREIGIIPAVRMSSSEDAQFAAEAIEMAGIPIVEITMTVPGAVELIARLARSQSRSGGWRRNRPDARSGAAMFVTAGAGFLTAPGFDPQIVEFAVKENVASLPGGLTPTEVVSAWRTGADFVKVFPCAPVGGDHYIRSLKTALPQISLIAAGGVNQKTARDFILHGASAIGVGTELIPTDAVRLRKPERIRELARRFLGYVKEARDRLSA